MKKSVKKLVYVVLFVSFSFSTIVQAQNPIWDELKKGGLVVFIKHTTVPKDNQDSSNLMQRGPTCKEERNLSAEGRKQALRIGERFRAHNIPIESVMNSPFCRTTDTANIAFGSNNATEFLTLWMGLSADKEGRYQEQLSDLIGNFTGTGNLILITHSPNISSVSFANLERNEALVLKPIEGDFEELGKIQVFDFLEAP